MVSQHSNGTTQATLHLLIFTNFPFGSYTLRAVASEDGRVAFSWSSQHLVHNSHDGPMRMVLNMQFLTKILLDFRYFDRSRWNGCMYCINVAVYDSIAMIWSNESAPCIIAWTSTRFTKCDECYHDERRWPTTCQGRCETLDARTNMRRRLGQ